MKASVSSFTTNMNQINQARKKLFESEEMDAETRNTALNQLMQEQAKVIETFVGRVMNSIGEYEKIPGIIIAGIKNKIDQANLEYENENMYGTGSGAM